MAAKLSPDSRRAMAARRTRLALLRAAYDLFTEHGYEPVTVRMIAKRADVSTGPIFTHWPAGKEALFTEAIGRPPLTDAQGFQALMNVEPGARQSLRAFWGWP